MLDKLESNILAMKVIVDQARNDGREDLSALVPLAERIIELAAQHPLHSDDGEALAESELSNDEMDDTFEII